MEGSKSPSPAPSDLPYLCPTPVAAAFPSDVHTHSSDTASTNPEETFVQPIDASKAPAKVLAPLDTRYKPPPSAFSRDPALTPVMNVRDSVSTQQSGTSSSLYPLSTSTASGLTSPTPTSPQSMADDLPEHLDEPSFVEDFAEVQDYDNDDVAYRLRLLVNNNYFLPPAHAKPSPASFAPPQPLHPPKKGTTPTFLDIFRVGKSKPKPTTPPGGPTSPFDPMAPMLRTAADSIAPTYPVGAHQTRTSAQIPRLSPQIPASATPRGRVVVVREKVTDIAVAAKQAEQDLRSKAAAAPHHQKSASHPQPKSPDFFDDVIDPTDAVDIPLPSPSYPFAVQSSNLNALGVMDSLGADVLAEHLPPSKNPNLSYTYDPVEDSWRKALLHEAVHMSLDNSVTGADTPDPSASSFSHSRVLGASTPAGGAGVGSSRVQSPDSAFSGVTSQGNTPALGSPTLPGPAGNIGQRIVPQPMLHSRQQHQQHQRQKSNQSQKSTSTTRSKSNKNTNGIRLVNSNAGAATSSLSPAAAVNTSGSSAALSLDVSRPSSYLPQRVDTPSGPMTPLAPPPRRPGGQYSPVVLQNAQWSHSQSELIPGHNHHHHHHHPYSAHPYASTGGDDNSGSNSNRTSNRFSRGSSILSSTLPRLRRAVSSPSLAEGYDSHSSDFFHYNHHPVPPLNPSLRQARNDVPPLPTTHIQVLRDSRATTMSFDTVRGSASVSGSSVHEHEFEELGLQAERGRASFGAVGGGAQGSSSRSRSHSRLGGAPGGSTAATAGAGAGLGPRDALVTTTAGAGTSRPSLSVSEYSQSSMHSPSSSTFQEMLDGEHGDEDRLGPGGSVETHAGSSRWDRDRAGSSAHGHSAAQGRVPSVASRYTAMSPPPRMSSSLAHVALPPPPRTSSLHYRVLEGNNRGVNAGGDPVRSSSSDSGHYSHPFQTATEGDEDDDEVEEDQPPPLPRVGRGGFLQERPATSSSSRSAPTAPARQRGHPFANVMLTPRPSTGPNASSQSQPRASRMGGGAGSSPYGSLTPTVPLTLTIPTVDVPIEIHSAPGPSSPTSFFDSIQAQPNAMDDLDSSSDEDEDEEDEDHTASTVPPLPSHLPPQHPYTTPPHHLARPTPASGSTSGSGGRSPDLRARAVSSVSAKMTPPPVGMRAFGMKLGNFSTPYLKGGGMGLGESKQSLVLLHPPVGHSVNPRSPVSSSSSVGSCGGGGGGSESGHGHGDVVDPLSPFDVYRHAQEQQQQQQHSSVFTPPPPVGGGGGGGGPGSAGGSEPSGSRRPSTAEESMRRLDGMLLRHMEDEKDTIKRIAAAVQVGATTSTSTPLRQHT